LRRRDDLDHRPHHRIVLEQIDHLAIVVDSVSGRISGAKKKVPAAEHRQMADALHVVVSRPAKM